MNGNELENPNLITDDKGTDDKGTDDKGTKDKGTDSKEKDSKEKDSKEKDIKQCAICYSDMDDESDIVTLKCGHQFHYDCILMEYKSVIAKNSKYHKYTYRKCPFCRSDGGYLPLKPGMLPIEFIHQEYKYLKNAKDFSKYLIKDRCHAILKTGPNKGCQCAKGYADPKIPYCKTHLKYYKKINK